MQLRPYQQKAIDEIVRKYTEGQRKIVFQAATGSGKTVTFSGLINRFIKNTGMKVLISVHREELLEQARKTLYKWYGIVAEPIVAGVKYRNPNAQVYVAMIQTARNRLKKNPRWFGSDIGMVIIDEAHLRNHNPLIAHFEDARHTLIVGFTATPISSSKRHPMNETYQDVVCAIDIPELIKRGALVPNKTYHIKGNVNRNEIKIRSGEFSQKDMFNAFKKGKHIENVVRGYEKHAKGKKTLIFNCNVEHSEMVNQAFLKHGYESKHLDGVTNKAERQAILDWFHQTPGAILQNVGVLTAGFDEPSTECVIMNRSTLSLPLWLQCTGRGSRTYQGKDHFTIIDLGGNALDHGDWSSPRDWNFIFHNPDKPKEKSDSVSPVKNCEECDAIISSNARMCEFCGAVQPMPEVTYDKNSVEFELLTNNVDMQVISEQRQRFGQKPYSSLHRAKEIIITQAKSQQIGMNETIAYNLLEAYQEKVAEWCKINQKPYNDWHKQTTAEWFFTELKKQFNWEMPKLNMEL